MKQICPKKSQKIKRYFECIQCNYITSSKKDYSKHLMTLKHKKWENETNETNKIPTAYECDTCNLICNSRTSLWRHRQQCNNIDPVLNDTDSTDNILSTSAILELIKQNQEFKTLLVEQQHENHSLQRQLIRAVKDSGNTYNSTTNNNNNQKFNLNFFLNTTCKDAMNMTDFIETMNVKFEDIENIGRNGYVAGMTDMIMSRMKNLDVTKRPMHCTDMKRETIYIKDNDVWEKDTNNSKVHNMFACIAEQNYSILPVWREEHPDCMDYETPTFDFSITMMRNVLGDTGNEQIRLDNKVIKNITKHINVVRSNDSAYI